MTGLARSRNSDARSPWAFGGEEYATAVTSFAVGPSRHAYSCRRRHMPRSFPSSETSRGCWSRFWRPDNRRRVRSTWLLISEDVLDAQSGGEAAHQRFAQRHRDLGDAGHAKGELHGVDKPAADPSGFFVEDVIAVANGLCCHRGCVSLSGN